MPYLSLLTVCISLILGVTGVAAIFVSGWVKASHLSDLRAYTEKQVEELRTDINKLWEKVSKVEVLSTKLEAVEKGIAEIKEMIREQKSK